MSTLEVLDSTAEAGRRAAELVVACAEAAIERTGAFWVALSGGSLPAGSKWHVVYADERVVPLDHADSNHAACRLALLDELRVPAGQVFAIDPSLAPSACATEYLRRVCAAQGRDPALGMRLDMTLLGMGPDGHTASLFPGHELLGSDQMVAGISDSPKPPPQRITLTLPQLRQCPTILFLATGESKAEALRSILPASLGGAPVDEESMLPAGRVCASGAAGGAGVVWIVDKPAASLLRALAPL